MQKIGSFGDPRLYALALVAEHLSKSQQPLVPAHMFVAGGGGSGGDGTSAAAGGQGLLGTLIGLMVAEKSGFNFAATGNGQTGALKELSDKMAEQAMVALKEAAAAAVANPVTSTNGGPSRANIDRPART